MFFWWSKILGLLIITNMRVTYIYYTGNMYRLNYYMNAKHVVLQYKIITKLCTLKNSLVPESH